MADQKRLHSFAVLAYKDSKYLSACIESLLTQSIKSDIYVATSTPSQYIENICKKYSLPLYINSIKSNISNDWNFAFSRCRTKYVTLAHQDDIYFKNFSKLSVNAAECFSDTQIVFTDYYEQIDNELVKTNTNLLIKRLMLLPFYLGSVKVKCRNTTIKKLMISCGNPIPCPSVTYNKTFLGNFKFNYDFLINLDWDAWLRLAKQKGSFVRVGKKLMSHLIHPDSATSEGLKESIRQNEDKLIFSDIWPGFFARIIYNIYKYSYNSNKSD